MSMTIEELKEKLTPMISDIAKEAVAGFSDEKIESLIEVKSNKLVEAINKTTEDKDAWKTKTLSLMKAVARGDRASAKEYADAYELGDDFSVNKQVSSAAFLVHPEYGKQLYDILETFGLARRNCTIIPMGSNQMVLHRFLTQMQAYWVGASHVKEVAEVEGDTVDLYAKKLAVILMFEEQQLADASINYLEFLKPQLANAFARAEDHALFNGNTTAGIIGLNTLATAYTIGSQSIYGVTFDDLKHATESVAAGALDDGCKWYFTYSVFNILRNVKDSNGNYIYQKPSEGKPATIWGWPYEIVSDLVLPAANTSDAPDTCFIYFGNMKHAVIGDRETLEFMESKEATIRYTLGGQDYVKDLYQMDMLALRAVRRVGIVILFPTAFIKICTSAACS